MVILSRVDVYRTGVIVSSSELGLSLSVRLTMSRLVTSIRSVGSRKVTMAWAVRRCGALILVVECRSTVITTAIFV